MTKPLSERLSQNCFARHGYRTVEAEDGFRALQLCHQQEYDLIVSDVIMPGMSGMELIAKLKEHGCPARILLISSYVGDCDPTVPILAKPFTAQGLLAAVDGIMSETR